MRIAQFYELISFGAKIDDVAARYPQISDELLQFKDIEPKYLEWLAKRLLARKSGQDDFNDQDIKPTISSFIINSNRIPSNKRDINSFKTFKELEDLIKEINSTKSSTEKREFDRAGGVKIYEDDVYDVYRIDTKDAAKLYGAGTRWCLTGADTSHFEDYSKSNAIHYFVLNKTLDKSDEFYKLAITYFRDYSNDITSSDFRDAKDSKISAIIPNNILSLTKRDAESRPANLLYRLNKGNGTREEAKTHWDACKLDVDKMNLIEAFMFSENSFFHDLYITDLLPRQIDRYLSLNNDERGRIGSFIIQFRAPEILKNKLIEQDMISRKLQEISSKSQTLEEQLECAKDAVAQEILAMNPWLKPEVQRILAKSKNKYVLRRLYENPTVLPEIKETLQKKQSSSRLRAFSLLSMAGTAKDQINLYPQYSKEIKYLKDRNIDGSYLIWAVAQLRDGFGLVDIYNLLSEFKKLKESIELKDINFYDADSLRDVLDAKIQKRIQKYDKKERIDKINFKSPDEAGQSHSSTIYDKHGIVVRKITSLADAMHYGSNTDWCTARSEQNYYGALYADKMMVIIETQYNPPYHKIAVVYDPQQGTFSSFNANDGKLKSGLDLGDALTAIKEEINADTNHTKDIVTIQRETPQEPMNFPNSFAPFLDGENDWKNRPAAKNNQLIKTAQYYKTCLPPDLFDKSVPLSKSDQNATHAFYFKPNANIIKINTTFNKQDFEKAAYLDEADVVEFIDETYIVKDDAIERIEALSGNVPDIGLQDQQGMSRYIFPGSGGSFLENQPGSGAFTQLPIAN